MVSIVVPTYNEEENIEHLLTLINQSFVGRINDYEVIVVDDNSTDSTKLIIDKLSNTLPVRLFAKEGKKGKAYSLFEGFAKAKGEIIAMIDADLQYPVDAISKMAAKLNRNTDIVVANRKKYDDSKLRKFLSRGFKNLFGKTLFNLDCDVQSGLKVFKRSVVENIKFKPKSAWSFDLEFLHRSQNAGFKIANHDITFFARKNGKSKIAVFKTVAELGSSAIRLKSKKIKPLLFAPVAPNTMRGAGVGYKGKKYITHTTLEHQYSALHGFLLWQKLAILIIISSIAISLILWTHSALISIVSILSTIYVVDVLFNFFLIARSLYNPPEITFKQEELDRLKDEDLPIYSILCPLYKEAAVVSGFLEAVDNLDYPKEKLDVLLLLEEDDKQTQDEVDRIGLPSYVRKIIVPDSLPKTKPKACNYGLSHAKGEFLVIFDAEDIPEPQQLKKALIAFSKVPRDVLCLQAKLNYHNVEQNLLTRLFTAEYSLWFDVILMGLQSIRTSIPLGGTSNHFPTAELKKLQGWDPFNVTEDADLGIRLFKAGFKTAVIDSMTLEEANSNVGNWIRQRSRWIKGYMQTYLVHMRNPIKFVNDNGIHAFVFQLLMGGKIAFMFINPFLWVVTLAYFPLYRFIGPTINSLYPAPIFYMAIISLVFGNFMFMYYFMIGCAKREHWQVIKYIYLVPFYWLLGSWAACIALHQLFFRPHYWEKTVHGLNLSKPEPAIESFGSWEPAKLPAPVFGQERFTLRKFMTGAFASGSVLIVASIVGSFFNFAYNAYLTRSVSLEDFGLVSLMGSILFLFTIPTVALSRTVTNKTAYYLGRHGAVLSDFWSHTRNRAILGATAITFIWLALIPFLSVYFRTTSYITLLLFAPVLAIGAAAAVDEGFLSGNHKFEVLGLILVMESIIRFFFAWLLISAGLSSYVYAATSLSLFVSFLVGWFYAIRIRGDNKNLNLKRTLAFPAKFLVTSVFAKISIVAFLSADLILAKHFLTPEDAGKYAILSLAGKMIYFVGSLFSQFITPIVSKELGRGIRNRNSFNRLFLLSTTSACAAYLVFGLLGKYTSPILFGQKALAVVGFLPTYGMAILLFTVASSVVLFHQTKSKNIFPVVAVLFSVFEVLGIFAYHASVTEIVAVMSWVSFASFMVVMAMHLASDQVDIFSRNILDLVHLFTQDEKTREKAEEANMRVLIFNWRDLKHKWAGGAEVYAHEIAKKLVATNHEVTIFCGNDGVSKSNDIIDGVRIIRRGGFFMVYVWAFLYYIFKFRGKYDLVVDCENGIPFFAPLFAREPVIGLVHHVHQEVFTTRLKFPLAQLGKFLEGKVMPFVYRDIKMITVSNSSREDMLKIGLGRKYPIEVITPGIDHSKFIRAIKTVDPQIVYLGRLQAYKSIETVIYAMIKIASRVPNVKLKIAGIGESAQQLKDLVQKLGLNNYVQFLGRVSDSEKAHLLSSSWLAVQPSMVEGWGITAIEANASGTPVVAANVAGLRDSVQNPHTGFLVPWGDVDGFAERICQVLEDTALRSRLEKGALSWASNFSWEKSSGAFYESILLEVEKAEKAGVAKDIVFAKGETA